MQFFILRRKRGKAHTQMGPLEKLIPGHIGRQVIEISFY